MKIKEVLAHLEQKFPLSYQEDFDNCGVQCGDKEREVTGVFVCFEMSDATIDEAIKAGANLVISHHPLILKRGIQKVEPTHRVGSIICKALENKMVLYSMHTNLDSAPGGINDLFAAKLGLKEVEVLSPLEGSWRKIAFFVPESHRETVQEALFEVGCGKMGNYEKCAYRVQGEGCFMPNEAARPYIGEAGAVETVEEARVEMIFPAHLQHTVIQALYKHHPYEEPAFDIYRLENPVRGCGLGRVGVLAEAVPAEQFLKQVKEVLGVEMVRYYGDLSKAVRRVAVCGGSGSSFISLAMAAKADIYITGDVKYHDFHTTDRRMIIADIGHLESELFAKEIIYNELKENFTNFAVSFAEVEKMKIDIL